MTDNVQSFRPSPANRIRFNVAAYAAWAPGRETPTAWQAWATGGRTCAATSIDGTTTELTTDTAVAISANAGDPPLKSMPAMLRRRASTAGKMALQAAYAVHPSGAGDSARTAAPAETSDQADIPVIFCSRHGECGRSADLLIDLARGLPLSPTAFSLSVHNATGGLFSIARGDHANSLALAAGRSSVEHAAIEACGLLADGAPAVLLVVADGLLPIMYREFADCDEQSFGWAWLLTSDDAGGDGETIGLHWSSTDDDNAQNEAEPGGLQIMRFFLNGQARLQRRTDRRIWTWSRNEELNEG